MKNILEGFTVRSGSGISFDYVTPMEKKIFAYLETLPDKELVDARQLMEGAGVNSYNTLSHSGFKFKEFRFKYKSQYLYGNRKTIAELQERMNQGKP